MLSLEGKYKRPSNVGHKPFLSHWGLCKAEYDSVYK